MSGNYTRREDHFLPQVSPIIYRLQKVLFIIKVVTVLDGWQNADCMWLFGHIEKKDCIPVGCVPPARWPYLPACSAQEGGLVRGGVAWSRRGVYRSMHWGRPPLWTEFLSYTSENITLPQTSFAGGKNRGNPLIPVQKESVHFEESWIRPQDNQMSTSTARKRR